MESTQIINPISEEDIKTYNRLNTKTINNKLEQAHTYFTTWRNKAIEERANLFLKLAEEFETKK